MLCARLRHLKESPWCQASVSRTAEGIFPPGSIVAIWSLSCHRDDARDRNQTESDPAREGWTDRHGRASGSWVLPGMATVPVLAARLEISPATAYHWVREKKLVAWEYGEVIKGPMDQVLAPGAVAGVGGDISGAGYAAVTGVGLSQ